MKIKVHITDVKVRKPFGYVDSVLIAKIITLNIIKNVRIVMRISQLTKEK
jgi:hypothetical protein